MTYGAEVDPCDKCEELLQPYLDRELTDAERAEAERTSTDAATAASATASRRSCGSSSGRRPSRRCRPSSSRSSPRCARPLLRNRSGLTASPRCGARSAGACPCTSQCNPRCRGAGRRTPVRRRARASRRGARRARPSRRLTRPSRGSRSPRSLAARLPPRLGPARPRARPASGGSRCRCPDASGQPSSPNGEVTVPCAGHADQSGAGCRRYRRARKRQGDEHEGQHERGRLAGGVRGADDHDQPALVRAARERVHRDAAEL